MQAVEIKPAENAAKSGKKSASKGDAELFNSELQKAGQAPGGAEGVNEQKTSNANLLGQMAPTAANAGDKNAKKPKVALSAAALVAVAKKLPAKGASKGVLDLSNALKISEAADKEELLGKIEKLNKVLTKLISKLDSKLKSAAEQASSEPSPLAALLGAKGGAAGKIKDLIDEANALNSALPKRLQISKDELLEAIKTELQSAPDYGHELLDDLQFSKLLDLAQTLRSGGKSPDLSELFKLPLSASASEKITAASKDAQNVKQLINELKNELNISQITAERIDGGDYNPKIFAEKFPKLYAQNFFAVAIDIKQKERAAAPKISLASLLASKGNEGKNELALKALGAPNIDTAALKGGKLSELLRGASDMLEQTESKLALASDSAKDGADAQQSVRPGDFKQAFLSGDARLSKPQARAVVENFAQDFKEELAKFKAPIHKVSLALKPAELGEINVTMLARGQNLQVNLHSANAATMNIFVQNQAELRQALVNMGFTGLSMNFSGGEGRSGQQEQRQKHRSEQPADEPELADEGLNITLDRYLV